MTEPTQPANDLEEQLWAAIERGQLEAYLQALRDATVVVPISGTPEDPGWLVATVDGLPHITVFTSPEARQTSPAAGAMASLELSMADLAKQWPGPKWRVAVNPGLFTAVYLPGTFVMSIGIRLGAADPLATLQLPDIQMDGFQEIRTGTFVTENRAEQALLPAIAAADPERALRAVLDATLFIASTEKDGYTAPGQAGFRWLTIGMQQGDAVPVFTSRDRLDQGLRGAYTKLPVRLVELSEAWPNEEFALVVNPGSPLTMRLSGPGVLGLPELAEKLGIQEDRSDFRPGAEPDQEKLDAAVAALNLHYTPGATIDPPGREEPALLEAAAVGDRAAYLRLLLGMQDPLPLPVEHEPERPLRYAGQPLPWQPAMVGGRTVLEIFTSLYRHRESKGTRGGGNRALAHFGNLLRHWPDPTWDLAINPGTAIGAYLPGSHIAALSEWYDQAIAHELAQSFPGMERIDLQLLDAGQRGDRTGFLEILRPVKLWVVINEQVVASNYSPADPQFPWAPVPLRGRSSILVYTGNEWKKRTGGSSGIARVTFGELAAAWPAGGPDLALNPASPVSITLTAEEVRAFAQD